MPEPLFTPTTKAANGHDLPIDCADAAELIGAELFDAVRSRSLALYRMGTLAAQKAGILLADTKFEFGTDEAGRLYLIDEVLTPDSSRYWPLEGYAAGGPQPLPAARSRALGRPGWSFSRLLRNARKP